MNTLRALPIAVLITLAVSASAATAATRTEQRRFDPFPAGGAEAVAVQQTERADSCSSSFVNLQSSALRCITEEDAIRDPCFVDPQDADRAVCVASPWSRIGVEVLGVAAAHDGTRNTPSGRMPWALELRNGARCRFASGATTSRRGRRLNYICNDERYLWGSLDRSVSPWEILRSSTSSGRGWRRTAVAVSWR